MLSRITILAYLLEKNGVNVSEVLQANPKLDEPATITVGENRLFITTTADNKYMTVKSEKDVQEFTRIPAAIEYIKSL